MQMWHDMWPELLILFFLVAMSGAMYFTLFSVR